MKNKKHVVLVLVAAAAATFLLLSSNVQSQSNASPQMKLGGAFIGSGAGLIWNAFESPLDPAGRTAALHVNMISYSPALAGLLVAYGADALSRGGAAGQMEMISRDTSQWRVVSYGVLEGNPPLIRAIIVFSGTAQFTDPDTAVLDYRVDVYPAAADTDGDGLPDTGTPLTIPGQTATAKRVTP